MTATQKLLDMINRDNPGANLVLNDVVIAPANDNLDPIYPRDTVVEITAGPSQRLRGSVRVWYNRLDLGTLFLHIDPTVDYDIPDVEGVDYTTYHILPSFNAKFGLDLREEDIVELPLVMAGGIGLATITAQPGNVAWKGSVEVTFGTDVPSLAQLILTTTLTGFNQYGDDPTKGSAAIYSYNLDGSNDPDLFWHQLSPGIVDEKLVEHFGLLAELGARWVYTPSPAPYNLYGATVDYSGINTPNNPPEGVVQPLNPVFDNVAIITLSGHYCVNFAGKLTVYSNGAIIVEPIPDWHSTNYSLEDGDANNEWVSDTELFVDSSVKLIPQSSLVMGVRPLEVVFDITGFGIDVGEEEAGSWTMRITAHSEDGTIIGSVDVLGDGSAVLELDNHDHDIAYFQFNDQLNGGCYLSIGNVEFSGTYVPPTDPIEPEEPTDPESETAPLGPIESVDDEELFTFRMVPTAGGWLDSEVPEGAGAPDYTVNATGAQGSLMSVSIGETLTLTGGMPSQRQIFEDFSHAEVGSQINTLAQIGEWDLANGVSNGTYRAGGRNGRPCIYYYDHTTDTKARRDFIIEEGFDEVFFGGAFRIPAGKAAPGGDQHWPNGTPVPETFIGRSAWKVLWCDVDDTGGGKGGVSMSDFIMPSYSQLDTFSMTGGNSHSLGSGGSRVAPSTFWHFGDGWNCGRFWIKNNPQDRDLGIVQQEWFTPNAVVRSEGQGEILDDVEEPMLFNQGALCKWIEGNSLCQVIGGESYIAVGANAPCRIELGDHPDYYKCRKLAICPPLSWDTETGTITARFNNGDFVYGKPQYVFVILENNLPLSRYGLQWERG